MPPPPQVVHTLSKPSSSVCHNFYQDITGVMSTISSRMCACGSYKREIKINPIKFTRGPIGESNENNCYAVKCNDKYQKMAYTVYKQGASPT